MRLLRSFSTGLATVLLLAACGGTRPVADSGAPVRMDPEAGLPMAPPKDKRAEVMRLFMEGTQAKLAGQMSKAVALYQQCLKLDPQNDAAMFELSKLYHASQNFPQALDMAKRAVAVDKENIWYRFLLADLYQQNAQIENAIGVYKEILQRWPERYEVYFDLANSLAFSGKVPDAMRVYADVEKRFGLNEEVIMQQFSMLAGNGKLEEAEALVKRAIAANPGVPQYQALLADLYDQRGEHEKALALYKQVLAADPSNSMLRIALAEHYYGTGELDSAYRELGEAFLDPELDIDAKMQVLIGFFEMTNREGEKPGDREELVKRAYDLIGSLEMAHPESGKPHTIHGDFLLRDQRFEEARDQFRKALQFERERFPIHMQLIQLDLQLGDHRALQQDSEEAISMFPTVPELYLYNGIAHSQLEEYDKALEALIMGRDLVVDNIPLQAQFWSSLGDTYNAAGELENSIKAYERALSLDPDNPNTLNNYAYHLSENGRDLEKAEKMSRRSNELAPGQPSYLDTYAWVLFQMGRYEDARTWIERALQAGGKDQGVIVEHYGDILFELGEKKDALEQWRLADTLGGGSDMLQRKINEGNRVE
jgi:tetratricopeptide (TPR) repeat protein